MGVQDENLDLLTAAKALENVFGQGAKYIWAIGLLAAGQSSTMTGTYAGQFVMEGFLDFSLPVWQRVILTRSIAIVPSMMILILSAEQLTGMDIRLNILQSVQLPFALIPLIKFAGSKKIMGEFAISKWQVAFATLVGTCLFMMNFIVIFQDFEWTWMNTMLTIAITIIYLTLIATVIFEPDQYLQKMTIEEQQDLV